MFGRNVRANQNVVAIQPESRPGKRFYAQTGNQSSAMQQAMEQQKEALNVNSQLNEFSNQQQYKEQQGFRDQVSPQNNIRQEQSQEKPFSQSNELSELIDLKFQILTEQKNRLEDLKQQELILKKEIASQQKEIDETLTDLEKLNNSFQFTAQPSKQEQPPLKSHQQRSSSQQPRRQVPVVQERQMQQKPQYGLRKPNYQENFSMQQIMNQGNSEFQGSEPAANTIAQKRRNKQQLPQSSGKINEQVIPQNALVADRVFKGSAKNYKDTKGLIG